MDIDELRLKAKEAGIKYWHKKSPENLLKELNEYSQGSEVDEYLDKLKVQYGFDKVEYVEKFEAYRCYKDGFHVDWVSIDELYMLNGKQPIINCPLKYQPLPANRRVIIMPWRS